MPARRGDFQRHAGFALAANIGHIQRFGSRLLKGNFGRAMRCVPRK